MKRYVFHITVALVISGMYLGHATRFSAMQVSALIPSEASASVKATRITNKSAPVIDGVLEGIWQVAGKITFPNPDGGCFTLSEQAYDRVNPSTFTVYYLHDDINLYVAIETINDTMVESSNLEATFDQESDGLAGMAIERKNVSTKPCALPDPCQPDKCSMLRLMWHQDRISPCSSIPTGPPLDRDRMVFDPEWRSSLRGTWNNNNDLDGGYTFEFSIPLSDPVNGCRFGLGGWQAGDQIRTNIVLIDHDGKPGARFNDREVNFRKCWWGSDTAERLRGTNSEEDSRIARFILLSDAAPIGEAGDDTTVTARRINRSIAPIINGDLDDPVWQQAGKLVFPNPVGGSFTLSQARYNADDPGIYTVYFLHDDTYLYIGAKAEDRKVEAAGPTKDDDQASDGLISLVLEAKHGSGDRRYSTYWHKLDVWERQDLKEAKKDCDESEKLKDVNLHFQEGPPRYPYDTPAITWAPSIQGTWNDNSNIDNGYTIEYRIPLDRLSINNNDRYVAGDRIAANIVIIDHDSNPGGRFDACETNFKKIWWGFDGNEFYPPDDMGNVGQRRDILNEERRFIALDAGSPFTGNLPQVTPATRALQYIANYQVVNSGLIRSFPDEAVAHTYDNAVALIALADGGRRAEAQKLANALISVLEVSGDGAFFYDAYNTVDKLVPQGTLSGTGPNTWAAFALAYYGKTYGDQNALDAAEKVARWILNTSAPDKKLFDEDGGIYGGICHPFEEQPGSHTGDRRFPFKSTEQVLDTWHLLRITGHSLEADKVKFWLITDGKGWVETDQGAGHCRQNNRFTTGTNDNCKPDNRIFLDPQSWGSIFANLAGEPEKARGALEAAEKHLRVQATVNGKPIEGFGDSCLPKHSIIWYGGTAQMTVAYVYNGNMASAKKYLGEMLKVQNEDGSWNHSSTSIIEKADGGPCGPYESFHIAKPSLGETAWNYFALRDVNDGWKLPYEITTLRISHAALNGKQLTLTGEGFDKGAKVLVNGKAQKTKNDKANPTNRLIAGKAGRLIARGQSVVLQVLNSDGKRSPEFVFTPH